MIHLALLDVVGAARQGKLTLVLTNSAGTPIVGSTVDGIVVRPDDWTTGTDGILDFAPRRPSPDPRDRAGPRGARQRPSLVAAAAHETRPSDPRRTRRHHMTGDPSWPN